MTTVSESDGHSRIRELDSLRGLLAIGVLGSHLFPQALFWLWSCVDGFLVLSGFVITRLLLRNLISRATLVSFYARRALRIWPVYYLTLMVALGMNWLYCLKNQLPITETRGVAQSLVFLQFVQFYWTPQPEYFTYNYIRWFGHSWSLAVEDQFYWIWPVIVFVTRKQRLAISLFCLAMIAVGVWTRFSGHLVFLLTARIDGLALGALLAVGESRLAGTQSLTPKMRTILSCASAAIGIVCFAILCKAYLVPNYIAGDIPSLHHQDATWLVTMFAATYASLICVIWLYQDSPRLWFLRLRPLLWLGGRSYAIYMFHPLVQICMQRIAEHLGLPTAFVVVSTTATTLYLAHLSFGFIESKFAAFRRFFPMKSVKGIWLDHPRQPA